MFERFTDRARGVLAEAGQLAKDLKSPAIRRHHLLIALVDSAHEGSGSLAAVLEDAGVDPGELRGTLIASLQASETSLPESASKVPFTAESKKALELSLREALSLGHNYIGREHLLLGVLRDPSATMTTALEGTQLSHQRAREVISQQSPPTRVAARGRRGFRPFGFRRGLAPNSTPGLYAVLRRVQERAGDDRRVTTGDFLVALMETPGTHFESALSGVTLPDVATVKEHVDGLIATGVIDGIGGAVRADASGAVTINDPEVAAEVRRLVGGGAVTYEQLIEILRKRAAG